MSKHRLPLKLIKALEPYLKYKNTLFTVASEKGFLIRFVSVEHRGFYFSIRNMASRGPSVVYTVDFAPVTESSISAHSTTTGLEGIIQQLDKWISIIKGYEAVTSFFDDPILNSRADEIASQIKILDKDADIKPYSMDVILRIDEVLRKIEEKLPEFSTEHNQREITYVRSEIEELREVATRETMSQVWRRIIKVLARVYGLSIPAGKFVSLELMKNYIRKTFDGLVSLIGF